MSILSAFTWTISLVLLLIAAINKFNDHPTQRSGTTFFLFYFGLALYYLLLLIIWTGVILLLRSGLIPFFGAVLEVTSDVEPAIPLLAALVVILTYMNDHVKRADVEARKVCSKWAAIPREKDALALEIREHAVFEVKNEALRKAVLSEAQKRNISSRAVNFSCGDSDASTLFTKALTLYCVMFNQPWIMPIRSFLKRHENEAEKAKARLNSLIPLAKDFFRLENPSAEVSEAFTKRVDETLSSLAHFASRAVLSTERTRKGRYRRLADVGFWIEGRGHGPSLDLVVAVILGATLYFCLLFILLPRPGLDPVSLSSGLLSALPISAEIGISVTIGMQTAIWSRRRDPGNELPPIALWVGAALLAVALCSMIRLLIFAAPHLGGGLPVAFARAWSGFVFQERWAWRAMSAFITVGVAISCYRASRTSPSMLNRVADALIVVSFLIAGGVLVKALRTGMEMEWVRLLSSTGAMGLALGLTIPALYRRGVQREAQLRQMFVNMGEEAPRQQASLETRAAE
jgi:hypothetical protein